MFFSTLHLYIEISRFITFRFLVSLEAKSYEGKYQRKKKLWKNLLNEKKTCMSLSFECYIVFKIEYRTNII